MICSQQFAQDGPLKNIMPFIHSDLELVTDAKF